jgi:hypothetical protein
MRVVAIVGGLILGLLGLFMSVCGGGFLVSIGLDSLHYLLDAQHHPNALNGLFLLLIPATSLALGIVACRSAYRILRKHLDEN